ncbi:hypothetical protein [Candidatus Neptunichlamydia sp. REUL1]|uniref:hypothetical protein n=1 Tax=Candidatus Neptunichlamydia sp. REUL1 TaxID=3064277 RepID=UPI00292FF796|nr:hypothetical protein [Candidatus Neptunochlamydia sp. REUL1]
MISNAVQGFQNNRYHVQEVVGSLFAAALVKLGSKYIQQITNLTAFASAANGASVLVTAKSAHTLWTSENGDEKSAAKKALALALTTATVTTLLRGTTILKTRHTSLPALSEFAKPLAAASGATAVLTFGGIQGIKMANGAYQTWSANRAVAARNAEVAEKVAVVQHTDYGDHNKIQGLATQDFLPLADAARFVLTTAGKDRDESAKVTDEMIRSINTKAAELNGEEATKIAGWVDLARV